ncbi:MAG: SUMF1/EgtB/PvdO family nonheme iron enzyme [Caldilineaceae bacterium]|nr:SUMF1/EgtB/PvdO family nonheme iron enzyme [Caldilineaceae bacterium]
MAAGKDVISPTAPEPAPPTRGRRNVVSNGAMTSNIIVPGDNNVVIVADDPARHLATMAGAASDDPARTERDVQRYLKHLVNRYQYLDLRGTGITDHHPLRLPLLDLYIPLRAHVSLPGSDTWARTLTLAGRRVTWAESHAMGEWLDRPRTLTDLLVEYDGIVLLGDPGSGKTTFLKYLALKLATGGGADLNLAGRLPILLPISAYANALARGDISLQHFIGEFYRGRGIRLPVAELAELALEQGTALLLLDGVDEVQNSSLRALVWDRVIDFFAYYRQQGNKFVLTSRIVGYQDIRTPIEGLTECTLVDFDDEAIAEFIERWTMTLARLAGSADDVTHEERGRDEQRQLHYALRRNPGLRQLAANPLLLTMLVLMRRQGIALPDRRVELYHAYVTALLRSWNLARSLDRRATYDLDANEMLRVLAPIALWMHNHSPGVGLVKRERLRRRLIRIYERRGAADPATCASDLLRDMREHAGLLVERGRSIYGFLHLTLQEYLTATAVARQVQQDLTPLFKLIDDHIDDERWHEVIVLAIGHLALIQQREEAATEAVLHLLNTQGATAGAAIVLAGEATADCGPNILGAAGVRAVRKALIQVLGGDDAYLPAIRAAAGDALGRCGDPRFRADDWFLPDDPLLGFVEIPDARSGRTAFVARYPVTVAQFKAFVDHSGYRPSDAACVHDGLNQPVRSVSWYDAMNYCTWLTQRLREWAGTPTPLARILADEAGAIMLPTPTIWQAAAGTKCDRRFPWGNVYDSQRANCEELGLRGPTAVGCFPAGASPTGLEEIAGNVREWAQSGMRLPDGAWAAAEEQEPICGTSFAASLEHFQGRQVEWAPRTYHAADVGFRIVCGVTHLAAAGDLNTTVGSEQL